MIFAAGLGTRLKPLTDNTPKALVSVGGRPLLEHTILKLKAAGFDEIIINIHHFGEQIIEFVKLKNDFGVKIIFSDERDQLRDTGGAIKKAGAFFDENEPVLIHNVDILSDIDMADVYNQHIQNKALATLVVSERETLRYLLFDENNHLQGWMNEATNEVKSPHQHFNPAEFKKLAFSGVHVISSTIVEEMKQWPIKFSIIDFYLAICKSHTIQSFDATGCSMVDVGKLDALKTAEKLFFS